MLSDVFHRWEKRLSVQDTSRKAHAFDWGLEYLDLPPGVAESPHNSLIEHARLVLEDPSRFYSDPGPPTETKWDGSQVRFRSGVRAPENATNEVVLDVFEAPRPNGRAMIVLPQWNADRQSHVGLCKWMAKRGVTALRLTLPYHDDRAPRGEPRGDFAVSANVGRTLLAVQQAVSDVRRTREWLELEGYERVGVLGTSLGSCMGFLALAQEPRLRLAVLHHVSSYFSDVVWRGISTRHVRHELERRVSKAALRQYWAPISPIHFVPQVSPRSSTLLLTSRYDLTFPLDLSRLMHRAYRQHAKPHSVVVAPWGHYTSGIFPFKILLMPQVLRFVDRHL